MRRSLLTIALFLGICVSAFSQYSIVPTPFGTNVCNFDQVQYEVTGLSVDNTIQWNLSQNYIFDPAEINSNPITVDWEFRYAHPTHTSSISATIYSTADPDFEEVVTLNITGPTETGSPITGSLIDSETGIANYSINSNNAVFSSILMDGNSMVWQLEKIGDASFNADIRAITGTLDVSSFLNDGGEGSYYLYGTQTCHQKSRLQIDVANTGCPPSTVSGLEVPSGDICAGQESSGYNLEMDKDADPPSINDVTWSVSPAASASIIIFEGNPLITYSEAGTYTITATIDDGGCISEVSNTVNVNGIPDDITNAPIGFSVCQDVVKTIEIETGANTTSLSWILPSNTSIDYLNPPLNSMVEVSFGNIGDDQLIEVYPYNGNCVGNGVSFEVDVTDQLFKTSSQTLNHTELSSNPSRTLILQDCAPVDVCSANEVVNEIKFFADFYLPEGHGVDNLKQAFNTDLALYVEILNSTATVIQSYNVTLNLNVSRAGHVFSVDIENPSEAQSINVDIDYTADSYVEDLVALDLYFTERTTYDVRDVVVATGDFEPPVSGKWTSQLNWTNSCDETPSYEVQIMRLYNDEDPSIVSDAVVGEKIWKERGLSILTESSETSLPIILAEGDRNDEVGTELVDYIWRVRPIGNIGSQPSNPINWGTWSDIGEIDYTQPDIDKNWIYSKYYSEGNKKKEQLVFADGLQTELQRQVVMEEDQQVVLSETRQDFSGRTALTTLPFPLADDDLGFKENMLQVSNGDAYLKEHFDDQNGDISNGGGVDKVNNPELINESSSSEVNYYSGNRDAVIDNDQVAASEGFPYTRTVFANDNTGRVIEQAGVGEQHSLNGGKTVRTFYSGVQDGELARLFGDQAPVGDNAHKIITIDANDVGSVTYQDKQGKTIATALIRNSGNGSLDELPGYDGIEQIYVEVNDDAPYDDGYGNINSEPIYFENAGASIDVTYELTPASFGVTDCANYCRNCEYAVTIVFKKEDGTEPAQYLSIPTDIGEVCDNTVIQNTVTFTAPTAGNYFLEKTITTRPVVGTVNGFYELLDEYRTTLEETYQTEMQPIYELVEAGNLEDLQTYLDANFNIVGIRGEDLEITRYYEVVFSCSDVEILIPESIFEDCVEFSCDDPTSFLDFYDEYFSNNLGPTLLGEVSDGAIKWEIIPGSGNYKEYTDAEFGELLTSLIQVQINGIDPESGEPVNTIPCQDIWESWVETVVTFPDLRFNYINNTLPDFPGYSSELDPPILLENFFRQIDDKLSKYGEISTDEVFNSSRLPKDIIYTSIPEFEPENAYRSFYVDTTNPFHLNCLALICGEPLSPSVCVNSLNVDSSPEGLEEKESLYYCVQFGSEPDDADAFENNLTELLNRCNTECDEKAPLFEERVRDFYHNEQLYIEGDDTELVYNEEFDRWELGEEPRDPLVFDVAQCEIDILVSSLIDHCKSYCTFPLDEEGNLPETITSADLQPIMNVFTSQFEIDIKLDGSECNALFTRGVNNYSFEGVDVDGSKQISNFDLLDPSTKFDPITANTLLGWTEPSNVRVLDRMDNFFGDSFVLIQFIGDITLNNNTVISNQDNQFDLVLVAFNSGTGTYRWHNQIEISNASPTSATDYPVDGNTTGYIFSANQTHAIFGVHLDPLAYDGTFTINGEEVTRGSFQLEYVASISASGNVVWQNIYEHDGVPQEGTFMDPDQSSNAWVYRYDTEYNDGTRDLQRVMRLENLVKETGEVIAISDLITLQNALPEQESNRIRVDDAGYIYQTILTEFNGSTSSVPRYTIDGVVYEFEETSGTSNKQVLVCYDPSGNYVWHKFVDTNSTIFDKIELLNHLGNGAIFKVNSLFPQTSQLTVGGEAITEAYFTIDRNGNILQEIPQNNGTVVLENYLTSQSVSGEMRHFFYGTDNGAPAYHIVSADGSVISHLSDPLDRPWTGPTGHIINSSNWRTSDVVEDSQLSLYNEYGLNPEQLGTMNLVVTNYRQIVANADGCFLGSLCFAWTGVPIIDVDPDDDILYFGDTKACKESAVEDVGILLDEGFAQIISDKLEAFEQEYKNSCQDINDKLSFTYELGYEHYTLYYYNRAGDLIRTVPPEGVQFLDVSNATALASAKITDHVHELETSYEYNSLNQLESQDSPDGGATNFIYDTSKGLLRFSQNAKQAEDGTYSFSKYDYLGRIIEEGEASYDNTVYVDWTNLFAYLKQYRGYSNTFPTENTEEVTTTVYTDAFDTNISWYPTVENDGGGTTPIPQRYLRNRVSFTSYDADPDTPNDEAYTIYSYDPHGNVELLIQKVPGMADAICIGYDYDLISGNVIQVKYNPTKEDQFYHQYSYDSDNRLKEVFTSRDGVVWDKDANYQYYPHGPLKQVVLGQDKVQELNYAYTIHGWLKGINRPDISISDNEDATVAADAFGMALNYYSGDYENTSNNKFGTLPVPSNDLFNGNVTAWSAGTDPGDGDFALPDAIHKEYKYDKLNRIIESRVLGAASEDAYATAYQYDGNGNLARLVRRGEDGSELDRLGYIYKEGTNQLDYVADSNSGGPFQYDQESYAYDEIGNLTDQDFITEASGVVKTRQITWNVYGKVESVTGDDGISTEFRYDAAGNRVAKLVNDNGVTTNTYYVRDASGNTMAIYSETDGEPLMVKEQIIYGSDRLGAFRPNIAITTAEAEQPEANEVIVEDDLEITEYQGNSYLLEASATVLIKPPFLYTPTPEEEFLIKERNYTITEIQQPLDEISANYHSRWVGYKDYELKDHLGNVRVVIGDRKKALENENPGGPVNGGGDYIEEDLFDIDTEGWFGESSLVLVSQESGRLKIDMVEDVDQAGRKVVNLTTGSYYVSFDLDASSFTEGNIVAFEVEKTTGGSVYGLKVSESGSYQFQVYIEEAGDYYFQYTPSSARTIYIDNFRIEGLLPNFIMDDNFVDGTEGWTIDGIENLSSANNQLVIEPFSDQGGHAVKKLQVPPGKFQVNIDYDLSEFRLPEDVLIVVGTSNLKTVFLKTELMQGNTFEFSITSSNLSEIAVAISKNTQAISGDDKVFINSISIVKTGEYTGGEEQKVASDKESSGDSSGDSSDSGGSNSGEQNANVVYYDSFDDLQEGEVDIASSRMKSSGANFIGANGGLTIQQVESEEARVYNYIEFEPGLYKFSVDAFVDVFSSDINMKFSLGEDLSGPAILDRVISNSGLHEYFFEMQGYNGGIFQFYLDQPGLYTIYDLKLEKVGSGTGADNLTQYTADIKSATDYYPFGAEMPGRIVNSSDYRYGFNGKEKDQGDPNEGVWGPQTNYDYGFRIYNPSIGKFLSVDPLTKSYPELTPYQFASNRPIDGIDLDGLEYFNKTTITYSEAGAGAGDFYGVSIALRKGTARDMAGKTSFVLATKVNPTNQNLNPGSMNPKVLAGAEGAVSIGFEVIDEPTFLKAEQAKGTSIPTDAGLTLGAGAGITFSNKVFGLNLSLGLGFLIKTGDQDDLVRSISVSWEESSQIAFGENWWSALGYQKEILGVNGEIIGFEATLEARHSDSTYKNLKYTKIKVFSGVKVDDEGNTVSNEVWKSKDYASEEKKY